MFMREACFEDLEARNINPQDNSAAAADENPGCSGSTPVANADSPAVMSVPSTGQSGIMGVANTSGGGAMHGTSPGNPPLRGMNVDFNMNFGRLPNDNTMHASGHFVIFMTNEAFSGQSGAASAKGMYPGKNDTNTETGRITEEGEENARKGKGL